MMIFECKKMMISVNQEFSIHASRLLRVILFLFLFLTTVTSSTSCNRSCPKNHLQLPYPFGFSEGCQIRLNCTGNSVRIGEFEVQNVTSETISVSLPPKCNRSIKSIAPLFHHNYAATWQNGLLLQNCSKTSFNSCVIPPALLESRFKFDPRCDHVHCFSKDEKEMNSSVHKNPFMTFDNVNRSGCKFIYSSVAVAVDSVNKNYSTSSVSLEFQTVELGWWLEGNCRSSCALNANCKTFASPVTGRPSFQCRCLKGYEGDGFQAGSGCRKVATQCNVSKYLSGRCGATTRVGVLIGGLVAGAFLVTGLVLLCYVLRKRAISNRNRNSTKLLLSEAAGGGFSVPFYTYKEIERATYSFSEKYRLGVGAYGTVYAGKLHNDEWVAIKKIRYGDGVGQVMNEIKLLSSVSHPNLVRLLGFCLEKGEQILVYEFMPNGTLSQHLQRERGTCLPWTIRLNIATETAEAIAHLHSAIDPPIYHRDIKSSNILLDHNYSSKVADFGLSRLGMADLSYISTAPQGTPGYLDPQYHQNFHLSDKSDVYSFGVVLAEIITALKVVDFSRPQNEVNLASLVVEKIAKGCLDEIVDPFLEPNRDAWTLSSIHKVAELTFRCLSFHRDMRPSMKEVVTELEQIKLSGWVPLEENVCIPSSVGSFSSSPSNGIEMSTEMKLKKVGTESRKVTVLQRDDCVISTREVKDSSPVSVQDTWLSDQSSPSSNSLLGNATI